MDVKEYKTQWYKKNRERIRAQRKAYYEKNPQARESSLRQRAQWYQDNKERIKAQRKRYYQVHPKPRDPKKQERRRNKSIELKKLRGGACEVCGYSRNFAALEWHHRNEEQKSFNLNKARMDLRNPILLKEIEKCVLLCANCRREVHNPIMDNCLPETS